VIAGLLRHPAAELLAAAIGDAGGRAVVVGAPRLPLADDMLARRGFMVPLSHLPVLTARLLAAEVDVVHAFTAEDAAAARAWRRRTGGPVVFTLTETLDRDRVADRRLRLKLLSAAVEHSDAVLVPHADARDALRRWLAADAQIIAPGDAEAHLRLYASLRPSR
jgi:hypothetical protein